MFLGLVWLTSNNMFVSDDFGDKSPSWFLKILKIKTSFYLGNFKIFKNALGQFIPNGPLEHVITSRHYPADKGRKLWCENKLLQEQNDSYEVWHHRNS